MEVKIINKSNNSLPQYETQNAAGMDLKAYWPDYNTGIGTEALSIDIPPGESRVIKTGLFIELPLGYEAQIRSRSGLAAKKGIFVLNSPGTIDADYRGEILVILFNTGSKVFRVFSGDRIAQMIIAPVAHATLIEVNELTETGRGEGGLGSTGTK